MTIDSVTTQDAHEIEDSFFDRFTYESDSDYDDSYASTLFEDKEYDIVSMITDLNELQDQVFHEWGMITTDETIMNVVKENPDPGSKIVDSGSRTEPEDVAVVIVEPTFQLPRVAIGAATRQMGTVLKDGRDIGAQESYVPACRGTYKKEDRLPSTRPHTPPGESGLCNICDEDGLVYEECSSCQSAPNWVREAFYYPPSPDDPGWRESLLYNPFLEDRVGELRYETWESGGTQV
jgi:hypothetical protein